MNSSLLNLSLQAKEQPLLPSFPGNDALPDLFYFVKNKLESFLDKKSLSP
jgi:hypothetical protein